MPEIADFLLKIRWRIGAFTQVDVAQQRLASSCSTFSAQRNGSAVPIERDRVCQRRNSSPINNLYQFSLSKWRNLNPRGSETVSVISKLRERPKHGTQRCVRSAAGRLCSGLLLTLLITSGLLSAQAPNIQPATAYTVDITDLSQKFVDFYNASVAEQRTQIDVGSFGKASTTSLLFPIFLLVRRWRVNSLTQHGRSILRR